MFGPLITTFYNSFFNMRTVINANDVEFVGIMNYLDVFKDQTFISSMRWTLEFTFISVLIELILSVLFALLMNKKFKGQTFMRITILLPWAIPAVVVGIVWTDMFNYNGLINTILLKLGLIQENIFFLGQTNTAKMAIIVADVWKSVPYMSLLILAGLMGISSEYYEAAQMDGAGKWRQFKSITLPLLMPTISVSLLFRLIAAMRSYGLVIAMTGGGPGDTTQTIAMYTVNSFFRFGKTSYGSALSIVMLFVSLLISLFFFKSLQKKGDL